MQEMRLLPLERAKAGRRVQGRVTSLLSSPLSLGRPKSPFLEGRPCERNSG